MSLPKLLITGCNGLVGRILWNALDADYRLYGLDHSPGVQAENVYLADITDPLQLEAVFSRISPLSYVIHLAGDPKVEATWDSVFANNIGGTKNIYEAARKSGVKRIVFASSSHTTGAYEGIPPTLYMKDNPGLITVRDPIRPDSFYGVSKAAGEAIARMYFELFGLEAICLRIGSVIKDDNPGAHPRYESTWLSHRDLVDLVRKSLSAQVQFGIFYGVSDNAKRFWDISDTMAQLGYRPQDNASKRIRSE